MSLNYLNMKVDQVQNKKTKVILLLICLLGFAVRVIYSLSLGAALQFPDELRYWEEATNIIDKGSFHWGDVYAHDMPLTAFFVAGIIKLTSCGIVGVRIAFSFVSACTIYFIANITGLFSKKDSAVLIAALISACYPFFVFYSALILSETLFLFAISVYFYFLLCSHKSAPLLAGLLSGVCHLIRPSLMYFFPVVWCWQYFIRKISFKYVLLGILCFVVLIIPWGVRNQIVLGQFLLSTSGTGQVLWEGNNPSNISGGTSGEFRGGENYLKNIPSGVDELKIDEWKKQKAVRFIKEQPKRFVEMCWKRFLRFWHLWPNYPSYSKGIYKWLSLFSFGPVLFFAAITFWTLPEHRTKLSLIAVFIIYYTAIHVISIGSIRYRLPLEPLLISLSAVSFSNLFSSKMSLYFRNREPRLL